MPVRFGPGQGGGSLPPQLAPFEGVAFVAYGDSLGRTDVVPLSPAGAWPQRLSRRIGAASLANRCVGGDTMHDAARRAAGTADPLGTPVFGLVGLVAGGNDLRAGQGAANLEAFGNGVRTFLALARARSATQAATATKSGTWTATADAAGLGGTSQVTTESGASLTFTVPAGTTDTTLMLLLTPTGNAGSSVSVDGGPEQPTYSGQQFVASTNGGNGPFPRPVNIRGLAPGSSHTITVRHTGSAGAPVRVSGLLPWGTEPAQVAVLDLIKAGPLIPFDATGFQAKLRAVLAEYPTDGATTLVTGVPIPTTAAAQAPFFAADGVHLNDRGQSLLTDTFVSSLAGVPFRAGLNRSILA